MNQKRGREPDASPRNSRRGQPLPRLRRRSIMLWSAATAAIGFLSFSLVLFTLAKNLPSGAELDERKISQSTKIYDRTGKILLYEIHNSENRTVVPPGAIPQSLKDATVATEDENFYTESGFSWSAILRALAVNALHGRILQGGSTITQQLAKNAFLSSDQTITRKLKEFLLALKLNRRYSKDEILSLYLNQIPYGPAAYGVEAASELYFGKPVGDVDLAQAAVLAALPRAPSYYSPWGSHVNELLGRQKYILQRMYNLGKINRKELNAALAEKIAFSPRAAAGIRAPHFVEAVEDYLIQKYGEDAVREGGLKVITTLDWGLQQLAEKTVKEGAERNETLYQGKNAALVAEDPKTGQLLSLVGSRDYFDVKNEGNFDVAIQGLRQPGSALKPFAYLTLFEKGYSPDTVLFDVPTEFASGNPTCPAEPDFSNDNPTCFHPEDFSGTFQGPMPLRRALAQSVNVPSVKVLYLAGLNNTLETLRSFGITTLNEPDRYGLSLVLGGGEVKLIDLVGAYATLSQEGVRHQQTMVLEVRGSNNQLLESYQDKSVIAADAEYPRLVNDILSDADLRAGLFRNSLELTVFPDYDVALKTGTTNDYRDAWAMGYTPSFVVGVWAGNNDNAPMQKNAGSILAAVPLWHDFMAEALKTRPNETFNRPASVAESKPMLNGEYQASKQIHSILFYVDKSNPLGPVPANPASDPQFSNWESGVLDWAKNNVSNFSEYNLPVAGLTAPEVPLSSPAIAIIKPGAGDFTGASVDILADVAANSGVKRINVYFNGQQAGNFSGDFGVNYRFAWSFAPDNEAPQNLLEIEVIDGNNQKSRVGVIVYK